MWVWDRDSWVVDGRRSVSVRGITIQVDTFRWYPWRRRCNTRWSTQSALIFCFPSDSAGALCCSHELDCRYINDGINDLICCVLGSTWGQARLSWPENGPTCWPQCHSWTSAATTQGTWNKHGHLMSALPVEYAWGVHLIFNDSIIL